jgi:hypothetical protein
MPDGTMSHFIDECLRSPKEHLTSRVWQEKDRQAMHIVRKRPWSNIEQQSRDYFQAVFSGERGTNERH